jgi:hypothetical protein
VVQFESFSWSKKIGRMKHLEKNAWVTMWTAIPVCTNFYAMHDYFSCTHVKISHLVASLPTSRQQDVFALLVTSCQQVWNNL